MSATERGVGVRDARTGRDGLPGVDLPDRDRPAGADRPAARCLFEGVDAGAVALEQVRAEPTQRVTHLTYAVRQR